MSSPGTDTTLALREQLDRTERQASARQRQLERYATDLREVFKQERNRALELRKAYRATVRALSNAVEARDAYTGKHAERVTAYGIALAQATGLDTDQAPEIEFGFLLHDVGKVAVPDAVLFKPAALDEEEFELIAQHPVIGSEILSEVDFLGVGKLVVRHHHERWDGSGQLIATTLEDVAGYELQEAADGAEAVERAVQARPEIVFLDVEMPQLDGIEACRRLRSDPATAGATIVMLTGASGPQAERGALAAGADLFLTKPFSPLHLLRLVDRIGASP